MKLTKAIEIGELNIKEAGKKMPPDTLDALKLLVNSAKELKFLRSLAPTTLDHKLPGETEGD